MKRFSWRLAMVTLLKTFIHSTLLPLATIEVVLDLEFVMAVYVAVVSATISTGLMFAQILERYIRTKEATLDE